MPHPSSSDKATRSRLIKLPNREENERKRNAQKAFLCPCLIRGRAGLLNRISPGTSPRLRYLPSGQIRSCRLEYLQITARSPCPIETRTNCETRQVSGRTGSAKRRPARWKLLFRARGSSEHKKLIYPEEMEAKRLADEVENWHGRTAVLNGSPVRVGLHAPSSPRYIILKTRREISL